MFRRRRARGLKRAIEQAKDPELATLREELAAKQERVAELELELSDARAEISRFELQLERRLGPLQRRLDEVRAKLEDARRKAARRAQWGDRADSPDIPEDVVEQFRKTWSRPERPNEPPPKKPADSASEEQIKRLFRALAKRFHPDLVTDPQEKRRREGLMARINAAYAARDQRALEKLVGEPDTPRAAEPKSRAEVLVELRGEVQRLNRVITSLERELRRLAHSSTVMLKLDVTIARRAGRDLLGEMAEDLRAQIAQAEAELARMGS